MKSVSNWLFDLIYFLLPGFLYLSVAFIIIQHLSDNYLLNLIKDNKEYFPYISILTIAISYVIGLSMYLASEQFIFWIIPKFKKKGISFGNNSKEKQISYQKNRETFIMIRHLIFSIFLLGISLLLWSNDSEKPELQRFLFYTFIICMIFSAILIIAYIFQRNIMIEFDKEFSIKLC
jgi:predicted tellurium resistance membrane protein TerC